MGKDIKKILSESEVIDVGEAWFKVLALPNNVFGIHEPHHWQEVISYLIVGSDKAILFDTGMGIKDISKVVNQLTDKEIIVVNSGSQQNEEVIVRDFQSRYDNIKYIKTG